MSYFLALDCSMPSADIALLRQKGESLELLGNSSWIHKAFQSTHSDKLVSEIDRLLKKTKLNLKELKFLALGTGPGRFTGVRTAVTAVKTLSFCLDIPIYSVSSFKILAEEFYKPSKSIFVSLYAFKDQVYFGELFNQKENISVLTFEQWRKKMESLLEDSKKESVLCISDLEDFYHLEPSFKKRVSFKKPKISGFNLAKVILRENIKAKKWVDLRACYLRSSF